MRRKIDYLWFLIVSWLEEHEPKVCRVCGALQFAKDMQETYSTTGQKVDLCKDCHRKLFRPFGDDPADAA